MFAIHALGSAFFFPCLLTCQPACCLRSALAAARCPRDVAAAAAAYDPAYLLPFSLACLGVFSTPPDAPETTAAAGGTPPCVEAATFVQWGLLAMCLRCLGTKDTPLRCACVNQWVCLATAAYYIGSHGPAAPVLHAP